MNLLQIKKVLNNRIEDVLSKLGIKYEVFGDNIYSTCPVHESSDNPRAFSFSKNRGIWKCWTRECQNNHKNDIFGLISGALSNEKGEDVGFGDVLGWIRKEFNLNIDEQNAATTIEPQEEKSDFEELIDLLKETATKPTINSVDVELSLDIPSKYFLNRGFKKKTLEHFGVGDCLDKTCKLYDRSVIPIHSECGQIIGYIGRSIKEYKIPKFLIYPKGFDKRFHFYNIHRALPYIHQSNSVFIVEGQGDLWKLHEAGIYNAVGIFGKTLTKEQQSKLQQLPLTHIIILTDNDQAGRESKIQLQRQLGRFYKLSFPKLNHKDIGEMSIEQIKKNVLSQIRG
jgi:5S rRNA maturation endonuclease (ribonuclease M5)